MNEDKYKWNKEIPFEILLMDSILEVKKLDSNMSKVVGIEGDVCAGKTTVLRYLALGLSRDLKVPIYTNDYEMNHYVKDEYDAYEEDIQNSLLKTDNFNVYAQSKEVMRGSAIENLEKRGGVVCIEETKKSVMESHGEDQLDKVDNDFLSKAIKLASEREDVIVLYTTFSYQSVELNNTSFVIDLNEKSIKYIDENLHSDNKKI